MSSIFGLFHEDLVLVYVEWVDTIGDTDNGWKSEEDAEEFFERDDNIVRETGFIYAEDKDYLYLVGKYMPAADNNLTAHRTKLPKKWILKRIEFKYKPTIKIPKRERKM